MFITALSLLPASVPATATLSYAGGSTLSLVMGIALLFSIVMLLFSIEPTARKATRLATTRPALQH